MPGRCLTTFLLILLVFSLTVPITAQVMTDPVMETAVETVVDSPAPPLETVAVEVAETPPEPSGPPPYDMIKDQQYRGEWIEVLLGEVRTRAFSEVHQSAAKLQKILRDEELNTHIMRQIPAGGTVKEIVDRTILTLRKMYSKEFMLFDWDKLNVLVAGIILMLCIGWYTLKASRGETLYIREIAGLASIDEAVGRCTEMGKPVLFVPGIYDMDDIQTISAMSILSHVAKKTAEYETPVMVPCCRSLVMSTSYEVVKESYIQSGKADAFQPDNVRYLTDDQFGYVAGVDGIMLRDKPAANFFLGVFFAESLILAETGHSIGSIQIAGTASVHQIPFFITACDYTLIGEELFAASAYLSKDPTQLGSIKGQDMSKFIMMVILILGIAAASLSPASKELINSILKAQ